MPQEDHGQHRPFDAVDTPLAAAKAAADDEDGQRPHDRDAASRLFAQPRLQFTCLVLTGIVMSDFLQPQAERVSNSLSDCR
jgi:hypothetical protein